MKPTIAIAASLLILGTGCDQLVRSVDVVLNSNHTDAPSSVSVGGPDLISAGWGAAPADGRGYATWTWDPSINNGCNEHEVEPAAELDNDGNYCKGNLP